MNKSYAYAVFSAATNGYYENVYFGLGDPSSGLSMLEHPSSQ